MGDEVFDGFGSSEEFARNVLGAFHDDEGAFRITNDDVAFGYVVTGFVGSLWKLQLPFVAETDESGEEGEKDCSEQSHAVFEVDRYANESDRTQAAEHSYYRDW